VKASESWRNLKRRARRYSVLLLRVTFEKTLILLHLKCKRKPFQKKTIFLLLLLFSTPYCAVAFIHCESMHETCAVYRMYKKKDVPEKRQFR